MIHKVVIIGATSGIGLEVARCFWEKGAQLGIAGRREQLLADFARSCGERVAYSRIDVTESDAGNQITELAERIGGADLILLCAGIGSQNPELNPEVEIKTVETNVVGFTRAIDAAFNYFKNRGGGQIAVISSIAGTKGIGIAASYSATKRYQSIYVQCLAQLSAMNGHSISFTDIRPGFVDTALLRSGNYPMLMRPGDVARTIVRAVERKRRVVTVDWRYRILVALWKLIPDRIWERCTTIKTKQIKDK